MTENLRFVKLKKIENYILEKKIGEGQFGDVYKAYNQITGQIVAIKTIKRAMLRDRRTLRLLENEISILKNCDNENIIKLIDLKKTSNHIYIILEYCDGGNLEDHIENNKQSESEKISIFLQVVNAFKLLDAKNVLHRDLKLQNILIHQNKVKLADFGFSRLLDETEFAKTILGSPLNMAPEILEAVPYTSKADIWSLGVCFYQLLFGRFPYVGSDLNDLYWNIKKGDLEFPEEVSISSEAKDIIQRMLIADPENRISWFEIFSHDINYKLDIQIDLSIVNSADSENETIFCDEMDVEDIEVR